MDLKPEQRARLVVIDRLMKEEGLESGQHFNVKVNVAQITEMNDGWKAIVTTDAHTDRSYEVWYHPSTGRTAVDVYTKTSHFWVDNGTDELPEQSIMADPTPGESAGAL